MLVDVVNRFGLVVVGYSGRDPSVMGALVDALEGSSPFPAGIRWVVRSGHRPLEAVLAFLDRAKRRGVDARLVRAETFDELAADINNQIDIPTLLATHALEARPQPVLQPVVLSQRIEAKRFPVLRCSALPILDIPRRARRLRLSRPVTTQEAREAIKAGRFQAVVAVRGQRVVGFGADEDLLQVFEPWGGEIEGEHLLDPRTDSWALGLTYDALVRSLTRYRPLRPILRTRGHCVVVARPNLKLRTEVQERDRKLLNPLRRAYEVALFGSVPFLGLSFAEGVRIRLENHDGRWWCVFDPFTWVNVPIQHGGPRQAPNTMVATRRGSQSDDWRRERWARRYNSQWSKIINAWSQVLVSGKQDTISAVGLHRRGGLDAAFTISSTTAWCGPSRADVV